MFGLEKFDSFVLRSLVGCELEWVWRKVVGGWVFQE